MIMLCVGGFLFFKQKTAYEMRISDWSSDVCSSDLATRFSIEAAPVAFRVSVDGDRLVLADTRPGTRALRLVAADPTNFIPIDYPERRVEFVRCYDGTIGRIILRDGDFAIEAVRAPGNSQD